jgi:hypothetical protein
MPIVSEGGLHVAAFNWLREDIFVGRFRVLPRILPITQAFLLSCKKPITIPLDILFLVSLLVLA